MLRLKLFGTPALEQDDTALTGPVAQRRRIALLALLATSPARTMARDKLATFLFSEYGGEKAHRALNDAVHALRKTLGHEVLENLGDALRLNDALLSCDLCDFEALLAAGDRAAAIALYRGPFLDGFFVPDEVELDQYFDAQRARLQAEWARAAEELASEREAAGDHAEAVKLWQRLCAVDPFSTRYALALMRGLSTAGNRAAAIRHADVHEALLREELGMAAAADVRGYAEELRATPPRPVATTRDTPGAAPASAQLAQPRKQARRHVLLYAASAAVIIVLTAAAIALRATRGSEPLARSKVAGLDTTTQQAYLRARYHISRVRAQSTDSAITLLTQVVARAPRFADGHALLALAYENKFANVGDEELNKRAWVEAETALALDPRNPGGHIVRGRILWTPSNGYAHEDAAAEYRRAIELDPGNAEAHLQLGQLLAHVGLIKEAYDELMQAERLNPADSRARVVSGMAHYWAQDPAGAVDILSTVPRTVNPSQVGSHIALALLQLGRGREAEARLAGFLATTKDFAGVLTSAQAVLLAKRGDFAGAHAAINKAAVGERRSIHYHHAEYNIASAYVLMQQQDSALLWLRRTAAEGFPCYPLLEHDPNLDRLRQNGEFAALLRDLKGRYKGLRT